MNPTHTLKLRSQAYEKAQVIAPTILVRVETFGEYCELYSEAFGTYFDAAFLRDCGISLEACGCP